MGCKSNLVNQNKLSFLTFSILTYSYFFLNPDLIQNELSSLGFFLNHQQVSENIRSQYEDIFLIDSCNGDSFCVS